MVENLPSIIYFGIGFIILIYKILTYKSKWPLQFDDIIMGCIWYIPMWPAALILNYLYKKGKL